MRLFIIPQTTDNMTQSTVVAQDNSNTHLLCGVCSCPVFVLCATRYSQNSRPRPQRQINPSISNKSMNKAQLKIFHITISLTHNGGPCVLKFADHLKVPRATWWILAILHNNKTPCQGPEAPLMPIQHCPVAVVSPQIIIGYTSSPISFVLPPIISFMFRALQILFED